MLRLIGKRRGEKILHIAVNIGGAIPKINSRFHNFEEVISLELKNIKMFIEEILFKQDVPVCSVRFPKIFFSESERINDFLTNMMEDKRFEREQVRVFVIGRWFGLSENLVNSIKAIIEKTEEYDNKFLCLLINYDGKEEILSAIEIITRKILNSRISLEDISTDLVKEELFSSYFPPPNIILEYDRRYSGMFLWDSQGAYIHFAGKEFVDAELNDIKDALSKY